MLVHTRILDTKKFLLSIFSVILRQTNLFDQKIGDQMIKSLKKMSENAKEFDFEKDWDEDVSNNRFK